MRESREARVQFPGGEDPLEEEMATHSSILAWKILWTEEPGGLHTVHGVTKSDMTECTHTHAHTHKVCKVNLYRNV